MRDETIILECEDCGVTVEAQVLQSYSMRPDGELPRLYTFAKCPRCESPFVAVQESSLVDESWDGPQRLYPPPHSPLGQNLPRPIQKAFNEAAQCLRARAYTASAIMCRKTLEGICVEHKINERNLGSSLKRLRDEGVIDKRLFEWAEELRVFGNEAAHGVNVTIAPQDAKDILDFTHALIEYVFTFQERFQAFKRRHLETKGNI